jgi:hypothetical protein
MPEKLRKGPKIQLGTIGRYTMGYGHYLVRVQATYRFRYTLPTWAIGNSKPIQVKRSPAIHDAKIAKKLSRFLASQLEFFVATSALGIDEMNQDERKRVLFRFLDQQINDWSRRVVVGMPSLCEVKNQAIDGSDC